MVKLTVEAGVYFPVSFNCDDYSVLGQSDGCDSCSVCAKEANDLAGFLDQPRVNDLSGNVSTGI